MLDGLDRVLATRVYRYMQDGNFSSASLPMSFAKAVSEEKVRNGAIVAMDQFGAGPGLFASSVVARIRFEAS